MGLSSEAIELWLARIGAIAGDVALKATLIIMLAMVINAVLSKHGRALLRSTMWNALLVGLVLLPLSALSFPRLRVACLPVGERPSPATRAGDPAATDNMTTPLLKGGASVWPGLDPAGPLATESAKQENSPAGARFPSPAPASQDRISPSSVLAGALRAVDWRCGLIAFYLVGVAFCTLRLWAAQLAVRRLRRSADADIDADWSRRLQTWRGRIGLRRNVSIACSDAIGVPLTVGWRSPVVLIPRRMIRYASPRDRDAVLLHELAHVQRYDYAWQMLLRGVQVIYWVHPLVWFIDRLAHAPREQACDALCVHHLGGARDYREALLRVAATLVRRPAEDLAVSMAHPGSNIERRLRWINRGAGAARCLARGPVRIVVGVGVLGLAAAVGSVQLEKRVTHTADTRTEPRVMREHVPAIGSEPETEAYLRATEAPAANEVASSAMPVFAGQTVEDESKLAEPVSGPLDAALSTTAMVATVLDESGEGASLARQPDGVGEEEASVAEAVDGSAGLDRHATESAEPVERTLQPKANADEQPDAVEADIATSSESPAPARPKQVRRDRKVAEPAQQQTVAVAPEQTDERAGENWRQVAKIAATRGLVAGQLRNLHVVARCVLQRRDAQTKRWLEPYANALTSSWYESLQGGRMRIDWETATENYESRYSERRADRLSNAQLGHFEMWNGVGLLRESCPWGSTEDLLATVAYDTPFELVTESVKKDGRELVRIELGPPEARQTYLFDADRGFSIVHWTLTRSGDDTSDEPTLVRELRVSQWRQLRSDVWFPSSWVRTDYENGERFVYEASNVEFYEPEDAPRIFATRDSARP